MTTDEVINGILEREGGFTNHPADRGGPTNYGVTAQTLGEWRRLDRPATVAEIRALTADEARSIYRRIYVAPFSMIPFDDLRAQLIDYGVNSGVQTSIRALQKVLRVVVDGVIGPRTMAALNAHDWRLVNNALAAERLRHLVAIVDADASQRVFIYGWCRRAVLFIV